jgi:hypothetical protein
MWTSVDSRVFLAGIRWRAMPRQRLKNESSSRVATKPLSQHGRRVSVASKSPSDATRSRSPNTWRAIIVRCFRQAQPLFASTGLSRVGPCAFAVQARPSAYGYQARQRRKRGNSSRPAELTIDEHEPPNDPNSDWSLCFGRAVIVGMIQ